MQQRTLTMVKPDAVAARHVGEIVAALEGQGFDIVDLRMIRMDRARAEQFYAVHRERPFYADLVTFITSGPVVAMVLEADNAIARLRETMGATDPAAAPEGSLRRRFGTNIERNAIHGSDSPETARTEIGHMFPDLPA